MAYGFAGYFGLGKETAWGTAVSATDYIKMMSESAALQIDRYDTQNIIGGYYEPDDTAGVRRVVGEMSFFGHPVSIGHALTGVLGAPSSVASLNSALARTEWIPKQSDTGSANPFPAYTCEFYRDITSAQQVSGVQFSRLQLSTQANQDLRVTCGIIGKAMTNIARSSSGTPTYPGSPVDPFAFDTASVQIAGAAVDRVEALSLVIDNQLDGIATLNNSNTISRVRRKGPPLTSISGTMDLIDITDLNRFINQTEMAMTISFFQANSFGLVIELPRVVYTAFPISAPGRERLTVQFEGKVRYHSGSATAMRIMLTTTKSNY